MFHSCLACLESSLCIKNLFVIGPPGDPGGLCVAHESGRQEVNGAVWKTTGAILAS